MLDLQPLAEAEFAAFNAWLIEDYAGEIARNYQLSPAEARATSTRQIAEMLREGLATPHHFLYHIVLGTPVTRIGYLWIIVEQEKAACFIAQIYLHPEHRRQGWGRAALTLLEQRMRPQGIRRIGLHVFAENGPAQALYRSLGYVVTDINMQKLLPD